MYGAALTASPVRLLTGNFGSVRITYSLPGTLPLSGSDTLVAQDTDSAPAVVATAGYSFS